MIASGGLDLAAEVAEAHAAPKLASAAEIAVSFSSGGLAFRAKGQPDALTRVDARLDPLRQEVALAGATPRPWSLDIADSADLQSRLALLCAGRRRFRWQPEDLGVFAAAALWTYLTLPLLLHRAESLQRLPDAGDIRRLRVTMPPTLGGHGRVQTVHIGSDALIRRHDYTATAFGTWARASQSIAEYETFDGVPIGTTRSVTPRLGRPLPGPTLVWIRVHSVRLEPPLGRTVDVIVTRDGPRQRG